jgi:hypothetical protein
MSNQSRLLIFSDIWVNFYVITYFLLITNETQEHFFQDDAGCVAGHLQQHSSDGAT